MPLPTFRPPSVEILVRTYHGDEQQLRHNLIPTLGIFVNRREFPFAVVLDEEAGADHALGDRLSAEGLCDRLVYEPLPSDWRRLFQGVAFPPPRNRWGYDRQQWSTFYMDTHSERDVLGVVDSDATFYSYLTRKNIFSGDGRVLLSAYRLSRDSRSHLVRRLARSEDGCAYRNDRVALGEDAPYDGMLPNRMPIWFWRSTYSACRAHIALQWGTDFDAAFETFSRAPYSAFNILANYAIRHEPDRYAVHLMDSPDQEVVSVGQNGCISALDLAAGGLRTFRVSRDEQLPAAIKQAYHHLVADTGHLNRLARVSGGATIGQAQANRHYATVWEEIDGLPPEQRHTMRRAFLEFIHHGLQEIKLVEEHVATMRERTESEIRGWLRNHPALSVAALRLVALVSAVVSFPRRAARYVVARRP